MPSTSASSGFTVSSLLILFILFQVAFEFAKILLTLWTINFIYVFVISFRLSVLIDFKTLFKIENRALKTVYYLHMQPTLSVP